MKNKAWEIRSFSAHILPVDFIDCKKQAGGFPLKDYIEERATEVANYIIETNATVRQTAKKFGVSKSIVHTVVTKWNGFGGKSDSQS